MKKLVAIATASLFLAGTAQAASYTLTFDQALACDVPTCGSGNLLSQNYGDVAGIVDITYVNVNSTTPLGLVWWDINYNDLKGVAWANGSDASSHARIEIKPSNDGDSVVLNSMDFGAYIDTTRGTNIRVTAIGGGATLFSYTGDVGSGSTTHNTFSPNVSSPTGLWIDWYDSAYNVGIDNVNFSITAVPEPETYAMLMAGLGLLGFTARRRKQKLLV
ncbi:PEP-CTERM sorting domain-containing protein [Propionivibrio sp.]|uniref:PEP-CTERM sorting domain-containing protein n=1 Tax=Propionivibrio sp. TaxID=2212460 RepID=UPI0025D88E01|nr:PEP-CTERM sorting domain-containing protein [Propionivibrio sp.]